MQDLEEKVKSRDLSRAKSRDGYTRLLHLDWVRKVSGPARPPTDFAANLNQPAKKAIFFPSPFPGGFLPE